MILLISLCENTRLFGKMPAMLPQHHQKRSLTVVRKNMGSSHCHHIQIAYRQLPLSIPTDFMHLVFEDVLTTLVNLLGGTSSNLEKEHFVVAKEKWEEIGRATANLGNTIPSCFAARFPISLSLDRDVRLTIGRSGSNILPVPSMYYKHIMRFSELERECLEFEYRRDRVSGLKRNWARWVEDYERGAALLFIINCLLSFAANNPSRKIVLQGQPNSSPSLLPTSSHVPRHCQLHPGIWATLGLVAVCDMRVATLDSREYDGRSASFI